MSAKPPYLHLVRAADARLSEYTFQHPWNPRSEIRGAPLARAAGLKRTGVTLARLAPGKESFAYHAHHREEEWLYVLAGRAVALIDDAEYELGPGDFVAFPTPSVPHLMKNPFDEELVYLMGGENLEHEVADFPTLDKRIVRLGESLDVYRLSDGRPFGAP